MTFDKSRIQGFGSDSPRPQVSQCLAGHALQPWKAMQGRCDGCKKDVAAGDEVMDCRECNWYLCAACHPQPSEEKSWFWGAVSGLVEAVQREVTEIQEDITEAAGGWEGYLGFSATCGMTDSASFKHEELNIGSDDELRACKGDPSENCQDREEEEDASDPLSPKGQPGGVVGKGPASSTAGGRPQSSSEDSGYAADEDAKVVRPPAGPEATTVVPGMVEDLLDMGPPDLDPPDLMDIMAQPTAAAGAAVEAARPAAVPATAVASLDLCGLDLVPGPAGDALDGLFSEASECRSAATVRGTTAPGASLEDLLVLAPAVVPAAPATPVTPASPSTLDGLLDDLLGPAEALPPPVAPAPVLAAAAAMPAASSVVRFASGGEAGTATAGRQVSKVCAAEVALIDLSDPTTCQAAMA